MDPQKLRAATRQEHEATEALMPLMEDGLTRATYVETLQTLHPLVAGWEAWAEANAPESLATLLPVRRRSQWLAADLHAMGAAEGRKERTVVDWQNVVAPHKAGEAAFEASFLGALYVMEGSTLGGRFLARHLASALDLPAEGGLRYFQGHGEGTGAMWREVTERIAGVPETLSETMTEAARRTFAAFGDALRESAVARRSDAASNPALSDPKRMAS